MELGTNGYVELGGGVGRAGGDQSGGDIVESESVREDEGADGSVIVEGLYEQTSENANTFGS
jgi:hypothetical protein